MASIFGLFFLAFLSLVMSASQAQFSSRPKALVVPVTKDAKTLQYVTTINHRMPAVPANLVVDLGGQFVWVDCDSGYTSSSYRPAPCGSAECSAANALFCTKGCTITPGGCINNTCNLSPQNGVTEYITGGTVSMDVVSLRSTDGYSVGDIVSVPKFIFACTQNHLLEGLASGSVGIAGLGKTRIALPSQLSASFSFPRKFAMCLSSSSETSPGAIFFGDGPYSILPDTDVSKSFTYTKMISNPVSTNGVALKGEGSFEYFIGVTSVTISGKTLPLNSSLISIGRNGAGGTKFSTVAAYSLLETSIYKAFTESFVREAAAMNIIRVAPVAPFGACFASNSITSIRGRLQVPSINLILQSKSVVWPIYPTNSMVQVSNDVTCLAFVDANTVEDIDDAPRASILLGGYQLENNLIQFDLATSRVGFTNMLYQFTTTCSSFKSSS